MNNGTKELIIFYLQIFENVYKTKTIMVLEINSQIRSYIVLLLFNSKFYIHLNIRIDNTFDFAFFKSIDFSFHP